MTVLSQVINNEHMENISYEFKRLKDKCYLDNAGATLYPHSLIQAINDDLSNNLYMNPHSDKYTRDCVEQIRCLILKHFNTDPSNYTVILTSGTTQALKLVVESFKFSKNSEDSGSFIYLRDNHTSVLGLREIAIDKNADVVHISHEEFLTALNSSQKRVTNCEKDSSTLLVYPAQNNFNGFKYPLDCIRNIKNGCLKGFLKKSLCEVNSNWYVLLDAASYVSTNKLDLSKNQPDFICLSFYKIFGFPTGLGALLVKNSSETAISEKKYFGGGTVDVVLTTEDFHVKRENLYESFEDGTIPFLSVIALKHCFETMNRLIPKVVLNDIMETICHHTYYMAKDLYQQLKELSHSNGSKVATMYMDSDFSDMTRQGAVVTFNLFRENGTYIGYAEFQHMADLFNISVRTGCLCNSGSCQRHLNVSNKEMKAMYRAGHKCGDDIDLVEGRPTGAIRVSFGYYNTFKDVDKLVTMICRCFAPKAKLHKTNRIQIDYDTMDNPEITANESLYSIKDYSDFPDVLPHDSRIVLKEISIFPIKSCGSFKVNAWETGPKGFKYDREWMIVKNNGICLTQKQISKMCLIQPKIDAKNRLLKLNFKGKPPISIPLDPPKILQTNTNVCQSRVCTDIVNGYDCGDEVADWISEALEISFLRLIKQSNNDGRVRKKTGETKQLSLSNEAQYLLINKATVRWLSDKIQDSTFMDDVDELTDRFRGNLVVDMDLELVEREWRRVIIGEHEFKVEGVCNRCQMVCIDQRSGDKTVEPLRTISEQFAGKLRFGIYLSYIGTVNGMKSRAIRTNTPVRPVVSDDDISR